MLIKNICTNQCVPFVRTLSLSLGVKFTLMMSTKNISILSWQIERKNHSNFQAYLFQNQHFEWLLHPWSNSCQGFWLASQIYQMCELHRPDSIDCVSTQARGRCLTVKCPATQTDRSDFLAKINTIEISIRLIQPTSLDILDYFTWTSDTLCL